MHVDFFTLHGQNYLLLVDSHSNWLEVERMTSTKAYHTVQILRRWFVRFGVPFQLVSDNGPQFVAHEFAQFLHENGGKHIKCSAYHPSSNGGAERFVQTVKHGLVACHIESGDVSRKLDNFLFAYRSTPSTVTGKTPSELFLGRQIRSRLDILKPCTDILRNDTLLTKRKKNNKQMELRVEGRQPVRHFHQGDHVLVRNHVGKRRWMPGVIARNVAHRTYIVNIGNRQVKRHIDDIRLFRGGDTGATIDDEIDQSWDVWFDEYRTS